MRATGSHADHAIWFRCPSCGEHTIRALEWTSRHASLPCDDCGGFIDLTSGENQQAIKGVRQAHGRLESKG